MKQLTFLDALQAFITNYLPKTRGLSKNSIRSYKHAFVLLIRYFHDVKGITADQITFEHLNYDEMNAFLNWLETDRKCAPKTRNQRLAALTTFSRFVQNSSFETATIFRAAMMKMEWKRIPKNAPITVFSNEEVKRLIRTPSTEKRTGKRDRAMLVFMYASGARAQEVCDLKVKDVSFEGDHAKVLLTGKGNKSRRIALSQAASSILKQHVVENSLTDPERHMFSSQTHEYMTISCIEEVFKRTIALAKKADPTLFNGHYTPHTMRHTTATNMVEAGIPLIVIRNYLGHSSVETTQVYMHISQQRLDQTSCEWNKHWLSTSTVHSDHEGKAPALPDFLK